MTIEFHNTQYIWAAETLIERYSHEMFVSSDYDDARAKALIRTAELERAMEYMFDKYARFVVKPNIFTIKPGYTLGQDPHTKEYIFTIEFSLYLEKKFMGHVRGFVHDDNMFKAMLDNGLEISIPCANKSSDPEQSQAVLEKLEYALSER